MEIKDLYAYTSEIFFRACTPDEMARILNALDYVDVYLKIRIEQYYKVEDSGDIDYFKQECLYNIIVSCTMVSEDNCTPEEDILRATKILHNRLKESGIIQKDDKWIFLEKEDNE